MALCAVLGTGCAAALNVGVGAAAVADLVTTHQAIHRGARELNPVAGDSPVQRALVKAAGVGAVIGIAHLADRKGQPILGHLVRIAAITAWSAAALHNYGVAR